MNINPFSTSGPLKDKWDGFFEEDGEGEHSDSNLWGNENRDNKKKGKARGNSQDSMDSGPALKGDEADDVGRTEMDREKNKKRNGDLEKTRNPYIRRDNEADGSSDSDEDFFKDFEITG